MGVVASAATARAPLARRVGLGSVVVLLALNIWTGSPLLALWVASRVQPESQLGMSGFVTVVLVFGATSLLLVRLLAVVGAAFEEATGQSRAVRRHVPWLRSMRAERRRYPGEPAGITTLERLLIGMVVLAVMALEIWFFFFAGSPVPSWAPTSA